MKLSFCQPILLAALLFAWAAPAEEKLPPIPPIKRVLPPEGIEIPADVRQRLETRLAATKKRLEGIDEAIRPDVEIFTKAVEFALQLREFYSPKDFDKADWALDEATRRLDASEKGETPWTRATGLVVRGYRSGIDESVQPYGVVIPENHDFSKESPAYIWLHGRGDKSTDLHFIHERATRTGQIAPAGAIVVHPFGRHCVGWKYAGEIDVLDVKYEAAIRYNLDLDRIVLIGFSMGGAGAWHLGAHHAGSWSAISPGAGFAETARYQNLTPERYPPWYEQMLWGQYDVPGYVRNLFNTEVIAYSGELDKQIQAARVMEEAYRTEGRELTHLIGPGVEHKYEPEALKELMRRLASFAQKGKTRIPQRVSFQTRTLRYPELHWVSVHGLNEHWRDARVDAEITGERRIRAATKNVTSLVLDPWSKMAGTTIEIDEQSVAIAGHPDRKSDVAFLDLVEGRWQERREAAEFGRKTQLQHGPIDDAFMGPWPFLVVTPSGKSRNPDFQRWMEFELEHLRQRWRAVMRAELPETRDIEVDDYDTLFDEIHYLGPHLILWGDADSNAIIGHLNEKTSNRLFKNGKWRLGKSEFDGNRYVPAIILPFLNSGTSYIVLNSGLTFREGHDRTNSLQNPKLPDWAIIDITQPPDAFAPGRIHDAGFFDEKWQLKNQPKAPGGE
jgi:pimeloyl-ACP methyl ester carboxylesterase